LTNSFCGRGEQVIVKKKVGPDGPSEYEFHFDPSEEPIRIPGHLLENEENSVLPFHIRQMAIIDLVPWFIYAEDRRLLLGPQPAGGALFQTPVEAVVSFYGREGFEFLKPWPDMKVSRSFLVGVNNLRRQVQVIEGEKEGPNGEPQSLIALCLMESSGSPIPLVINWDGRDLRYLTGSLLGRPVACDDSILLPVRETPEGMSYSLRKLDLF
jgi:hypothetical protein